MSSPATILCIETAVGSTSVALAREGGEAYQLISNDKNKASEALHLMIQQLLEEQNIPIQNLSAIALSGGPGSYTGLRIGAACAKGLCYALSIPLIHLETLKIMQEGLKRKTNKRYDYYVPMIDARRNDVYTAILDDKGNYIQTPEALTLDKNIYSKLCADNSVVFMGDGAEKFSNEIKELQAAHFADISAESIDMAKMAVLKWQNKDFQDVAYYKPFYYKAFYSPKI